MNTQEILELLKVIPPSLKDVGLLVIFLSLIEISPLKLNPWKWFRAFYRLPSRLESLEDEFQKDRIFRWRSQILRRADYIRNGEKFSSETWDDTIDTIDRYEKYCKEHPDVKNGKAKAAIEYLQKKYSVVYETKDFLR